MGEAGIISYSDGDVDTNRSDNPSIHDIIEHRYSRRSALRSGFVATAAAVALPGFLLTGCEENKLLDTIKPTAGDVTTSAGRVVSMTATVSGGTATSVSWTQVSGPAVTLTNANSPTTSFIAPAVATTSPLQFSFAATVPGGAQSTTNTVTVAPAQLGFTAVPKSLADVLTVPAGYTASVLYRLGDPISAATSAYANNGTDASFSTRAGDHHDGMYFFGLSATGTAPDPNNSTRGLLVMNHENITASYLHPNGPTTTGGVRPVDEAIKEIECHGVSVIEVTRAANAWSYVQASTFNRRITPFTPTAINGPLRGHAAMKTLFSPTGVAGRGTINNCANGFTPWNTYLTCEENWVGYFRRNAGDDTARTAAGLGKSVTSLARYGAGGNGARNGNNLWTFATPVTAGDTRFAKFNISVDPTQPIDGTGDFRNEINQYGWVVEIDPFDPASTPRKRTALGRFAHEGAWPGAFVAGRKPAWYMGDDAAGDYLYKFVSDTPWAAADATVADRLAMGDKYLDAGTLYVARFDATGQGVWIPLTFGTGNLTAANVAYPFADQADVLLNARLAGDAVAATRMDRPEWTAVNPKTGEMYLTLTNGPTRTGAAGGLNTDAANPRIYVDPPSAARNNRNGHIIRLKETGDTTEATTFAWDIYLFASGADLDAANINVSGLDATNDLSSPDGLWFSRPQNAGGNAANPLLWIETDDGAYTDVTNCMLLVGQPGVVGDGGAKTITNILPGGATSTQATLVGKAPGTTLRRFLVGPKECEITGIDSTPDGRSVFVNIQHPGENGNPTNITSTWPAGTAGSRPRSSTIVITKDDGGVVGV